MQLLTPEQLKPSADWRIIFGIVFSALWLILLFLYLRQQMSWQEFLRLPLANMGSFLGGAFSPLAFLWLVIGFFIQQGEIYQNTRNIEIQAQHTNLDNFLKMADMVYRQMGVSMGYLYISCKEEMRELHDSSEPVENMWSKASTGDSGVFTRVILSYQFDDQGHERDMAPIFFGTEIRRRHSLSYKQVFERLLSNADLCDASGGLRDALVFGSEWGILYRALLAHMPADD